MAISTFRNLLPPFIRRTKLQTILIVPFVLKLVGTVGLVSYLSIKNGQNAINEMAIELQQETNARIEQNLDQYLTLPVQVVKNNLAAFELGMLRISDLQQMGQYFHQQLKIFQMGYINLATAKGEYIGAGYYDDTQNILIEEIPLNTQGRSSIYSTDHQGNRTKRVKQDDYNPHEEDWYADAIKAGQPIWSQIYNWDTYSNILSISYSYPIYDEKKKLVAVMGVDLILSQISKFLRQVKIGKTGKAFIMERSGLMVASSIDEPPFTIVNKEAKRLNTLNSRDPVIRLISQHLDERFDHLKQLKSPYSILLDINHQKHYVQVSPWQDQYGLDWLVVVAIPESDFMGQINANTRTTLILSIAALIFSIVLGIFIARWITRPILRLNEAAKQIAAGKLDQTIQFNRNDELGELADAFNQMAKQLQSSFHQLEKSKQDLEHRVEERTASLKAAEAELQGLFAAMTDLVFVLDAKGRYLKIPTQNSPLLYAPADILIGKTISDVLPAKIAQQARQWIAQVLETQKPLSVEYSLKINDKSAFFAANISPISSEAVIIVSRDISPLRIALRKRIQAEKALRQKNTELTQAFQKLESAQVELIQSEKLSALGQLVAGIAHELNTPLGAIQASISNLSSALEQVLWEFPLLVQTFSAAELQHFFRLLDWGRQSQEMLSSREERQLKRSIKQTLTENGLAYTESLADSLSKMGITHTIEPILPLLRSPNAPFILENAYHLSSVQSNSRNIQLAVERAARIVYALKNYIRHDSTETLYTVDVTSGIETVLMLYHNQCKRGIEVERRYSDVPPILCYPEELTQIWSNLIHNAIQAMNYQGKLTITVEEQDDKVVIMVSDTGCGIPVTLREKIFEPFFTTKPAGEGSGLGLSIVRKIVDKHQGQIEIDSQPGHTIFRVRLPQSFHNESVR